MTSKVRNENAQTSQCHISEKPWSSLADPLCSYPGHVCAQLKGGAWSHITNTITQEGLEVVAAQQFSTQLHREPRSCVEIPTANPSLEIGLPWFVWTLGISF